MRDRVDTKTQESLRAYAKYAANEGGPIVRRKMPSDARPTATPRLYPALIGITALVIFSVLLVRLTLNFRHQFYLEHVDGAWLTCAHDFVHGVFYRPLFGPLGYGGTRYFPFYFVLVGVFSKLFGTLQTSALILSAASVVGICCTAWRWLRRAGVAPWLCVAGIAAILAASSMQEALLAAKGDALAAMLNLCALLLCLKPEAKPGSRYLVALLFTLAFATKLTTVFGVASVVLSWALERRYKDAARLAVATGSGYAGVLIIMYVGSSGRVFRIFRACAGGGGSLSYALLAPLHLLSRVMDQDPIFLLFLIAAAAFAVAAFREHKPDILPIYFVLTLLVSVVIFGSRGTNINHLLDLHIAAILLLILSCSRAAERELSSAATGILAFCLLVACLPTARALRADVHGRSIASDALEVMAHVPDDGRPVLAENPEVLLAAAKTPYLLDPFMFRILAATHPALTAEFWEKINHRGFAAIVLEKDPFSAEGKLWYSQTHFGGEFLRDLEANYSLQRTVGEMRVFAPK